MSEYQVRVEREESRIDPNEYAALHTLISRRRFQMYVVRPPSKSVSALLERRMDLPKVTYFGKFE
jgi:hypothetical protein